jgi:hypothetical protein
LCRLGLPAGAAEFGIGAVPVRSKVAICWTGEEFGGGVGGGGEGCAGSFGEEGAVEVCLDALEARFASRSGAWYRREGLGDSGRKSRW